MISIPVRSLKLLRRIDDTPNLVDNIYECPCGKDFVIEIDDYMTVGGIEVEHGVYIRCPDCKKIYKVRMYPERMLVLKTRIKE